MLVLGISRKKAGTKNGGKPGKVLFNLKLASPSQINLTSRENKGTRKYVALHLNITTNHMPSYSTTNQPQIQRPNATQKNAAKKERQRLLCLHLLAVQREQEKSGWPRRSPRLQTKELNNQWWNNGWPTDFPYAVAILCGEEGYLEECAEFKPNQSAATEEKSGDICTQWGLNNI
jgi:hypothetical protein